MTRHHKTPRREHRQNIPWHKLYQCLLRSVFQGNKNKSKNKQKGPNQTYKLLCNKGNRKQNKDNLQSAGEPLFWQRPLAALSLLIAINAPFSQALFGWVFLKFFKNYFILLLFRATSAAYGGSQAWGGIRPAAAVLRHGHSNVGSEVHLWPTPQLTAALDP